MGVLFLGHFQRSFEEFATARSREIVAAALPMTRDYSRCWELELAENISDPSLTSTLRYLCVLCASAVKENESMLTTEAQRTQR
jgi:hypothetical protein